MKAPQRTPPIFALAVPGPAITAPRDGRPLNQTKDALFIAVLHERSRATGWVVGEVGADGVRHYQSCAAPADGQARHAGPLYLSTKTLRRRLVHSSGLFHFRLMYQRPKPPDGMTLVASELICEGGEWCPTKAASFYLEVLNPPVQIGQPDALITQIRTEPLFSWCDLNAPEPAKAVYNGDWACPNCGIIPSTTGEWRSTLESWAIGAGRAFEFRLCVTCHLVFERRLVVMN